MCLSMKDAAAVASLFVTLNFKGQFCHATTHVAGSPWKVETYESFDVMDSTPSATFLTPKEGTKGNPLFTAMVKWTYVFSVLVVLVILIKVHGKPPDESLQSKRIKHAGDDFLVDADTSTGGIVEGQIPRGEQTTSKGKFENALRGKVEEAMADLGAKLAGDLNSGGLGEVDPLRQKVGDLTALKSNLIHGMHSTLDSFNNDGISGRREPSSSDAGGSDSFEREEIGRREAVRVMMELAELRQNALNEIVVAQEALLANYEQVISAAAELKRSAENVLDSQPLNAVFGSVQHQDHQQSMVVGALEAASCAEVALQNLKNILLEVRSKGGMLSGSIQDFTSAVLMVKVAAGKFRLHNPFLCKKAVRAANALLECLSTIQRVEKTRDEEILEGVSVLLMEVLRELNSLESVDDSLKDPAALENQDLDTSSLTAIMTNVTTLLQLIKDSEVEVLLKDFNKASLNIIAALSVLLDVTRKVEELNSTEAVAKLHASRILLELLYHASEADGGIIEVLQMK